jgi:hypothetical protein
MFWSAILFLILVAIFGRNVFRAIWWIIGLGILGIIGLAWFGSTLPDQPKLAAVAPTPTPALLEYGFDEKVGDGSGSWIFDFS